MTSVQVAHDFFALGLWQRGNLVVQVNHAVVDVNSQLVKQNFFVLVEGFFVEDLDAVTKHDGVRHLHHGGFDVQGEHHASFVSVFNFFFVESFERFLAHEHAVNDFALKQVNLGFEHNGFATLGDQFHFDVAGTLNGD